MTIIAESGATKTDWLVDGKPFRTGGINLSVMTDGDIRDSVAEAANVIAEQCVQGSSKSAAELYFYSAGMVSDRDRQRMSEIIAEVFPGAEVECASDLLAAARALWGDAPGVVAILGTGSNSCRYDGVSVTDNVRPGGYILGDEGGGAALGKRFLSDYIKNLMPETVAEKFRARYPMEYHDIVDAVYRGANPAGFMASFAPFIMEKAAEEPYLQNLVRENLRSFISRSLLTYKNQDEKLSVGVVGSVGAACREMLLELGPEYGLDFCRFIASPINALADYHSSRVTQKGNFRVPLDSKILMYDSTLRFSRLRKP